MVCIYIIYIYVSAMVSANPAIQLPAIGKKSNKIMFKLPAIQLCSWS